MEVAAILREAKISPQKIRLVADLIRGLAVGDALDVLKFSPKKGAVLMKKLLESAIANAENNKGADIDELWISTVYVDQGPVAKRMMPRAKGRSNRILKRSSHVTLKVSDEQREKQ